MPAMSVSANSIRRETRKRGSGFGDMTAKTSLAQPRLGRAQPDQRQSLLEKIVGQPVGQLVNLPTGSLPMGGSSTRGAGVRGDFEISLRLGLRAARPQRDPGMLAQPEQEDVAGSEIGGSFDRAQVTAFITKVLKAGH